MKKTFQALFATVLILGGLALSTSFTEDEGSSGRVKVYIVNNCSEDVEFRVESPGSATRYTAYDNSEKPMTFMEGTKIFNSGGDLVHEVSSSSSNEKIVVCD